MGSCKNVSSQINSGMTTNFNDGAFGSQHPGGTNFGMCDGAVKFVNEDVEFDVFLSTASRDGKEIEVVQ